MANDVTPTARDREEAKALVCGWHYRASQPSLNPTAFAVSVGRQAELTEEVASALAQVRREGWEEALREADEVCDALWDAAQAHHAQFGRGITATQQRLSALRARGPREE